MADLQKDKAPPLTKGRPLTKAEVDAIQGLWKVTASTGININSADAATKAAIEASNGNPAKMNWKELNKAVFIPAPSSTFPTSRIYVIGVDPETGLFWSYHTHTTDKGESLDRSVGKAVRGRNGKIQMTFIRSDSTATSFRELNTKDGTLEMLFYGSVSEEVDSQENTLFQQDVRDSVWVKMNDPKEEQKELKTIASLLPYSPK